MATTTVAEFTKLRHDVQTLRDKATRLETERDSAKREMDAAAATLTEMGFDIDGDLDAQLEELRARADERLAALEALLP